jgi:hypothetical protein
LPSADGSWLADVARGAGREAGGGPVELLGDYPRRSRGLYYSSRCAALIGRRELGPVGRTTAVWVSGPDLDHVRAGRGSGVPEGPGVAFSGLPVGGSVRLAARSCYGRLGC